MTRQTRWAVAIVAVLAAISLRPDAVAQAAPRLHLVILADTLDEKIGAADAIDRDKLRHLFEANVPEPRLSVVTLSDHEATPDRALRAIRGLRVARGEDTVVFYYSGHGAFSQRWNDHVMAPNKQWLHRSDVRGAIRQLQPRLAVVITDTCSVFVRTVSPPIGAPGGDDTVPPLFEALFFEPRGLVDISSTRPGESALGNGQIGGLFTNAMCEWLTANRQQRLTWSNLVDDMNQIVPRNHPHSRQTAYAVSRLPGTPGAVGAPAPEPDGPAPGPSVTPGEPAGPADPRGIRFGVRVEATERSRELQGVEVAEVLPGYPGTNLRSRDDGQSHYLVAGQHVITHINGAPVASFEDYARAVDASPREMTVRVYNLYRGTHREYDATLRY